MTALQWLISRIDISNPFMISQTDIEQAKRMEYQQLESAFRSGEANAIITECDCHWETSEQYLYKKYNIKK